MGAISAACAKAHNAELRLKVIELREAIFGPGVSLDQLRPETLVIHRQEAGQIIALLKELAAGPFEE